MNDKLLDVLALLRAGHWTKAHDAVQLHDSPEAAWLHALVHVQEGDLEDAEYWYGKAGRAFRGRLSLDEELNLLERDLRGIELGYSAKDHSGLDYVAPAIIDQSGKFRR
ncbi:hypothetical protein [Roseateles sp.]|uniref:hypothetical protein n=1 Tax=Roseateles sp. TaxID=1971397 RepID=UPI003266AEA6